MEYGHEMFRLSVPILKTQDSRRAEEFYCHQLGFEAVNIYRPDPEKSDPCYLTLKQGEANLHVSSFPIGGAFGSLVYFYVEDVDALHEKLTAKEVPIKMPPTDQTWGVREIHVVDPDGNGLTFGQPLED